MSCEHLERTSAFLDGELDATASAEAERHIETCADCQALVAAAGEASELLRGPAARIAASPELKARIASVLDADEAKVARLRPAGSRFWLGAMSGVAASAVAASLVLVAGPMLATQSLTDGLADAHVQALMQSRTIAVASSSHHTVKPWFAGRAPLSPPVEDFAAEGFALAGGRVDAIAARKAAVVVYRHGAHEIDLFVWARDRAAPPARAERRGYHLVGWTRGDLAFAAVSDVRRDELERFVSLVQGERE
jgi:anti-sigma factor RsiW